ncbi:DgyrCDS1231 [Dimorphilus gyrociliatus]|uniref:DgyrCDS1231 n=1 Tax=Dimorphilus gyrociliatus TaxID=2664684 RepID=A0A7I8V6N3_9ANNE|nr:DgyrCDS1231 [Dimorphilus gyrociliatus]
MTEKEEMKKCFFCQEKEAKYTCPKCNYPYCSLVCYKGEKHLNCSENFYKECFVEGLKDMNNDDGNKRKMIEILNKMRKDEDPDLNIESLEDRIEGLDLDNDTEELWSKLTDEEKSEFERLCKKGNAFVEPWNPWWYESVNLRPNLTEEILPLQTLLKKEPSKTLAYSILNTLLCYCYICRRFNGDYIDLSSEAAQEVQGICGPLACNETFIDIASSLSSFSKALKVDEGKKKTNNLQTEKKRKEI